MAAPAGGSTTGIGTWTKGAMDLTAQMIDDSRADHGEAVGDLVSDQEADHRRTEPRSVFGYAGNSSR